MLSSKEECAYYSDMGYAVIFKHECVTGSSVGLVKTQTSGSTPAMSDSVGPAWGHNICISNKFPKLRLMPQTQGSYSGNHWLEVCVQSVHQGHHW